MLYQTHHPFLFQFQSFASVPLSVTTTIPLSRFPLLSSSTQEMECVEAALKSSIRKEMALKSSPQAFFDDLLAVNAQNGVSCDDFFVDDLLDLSNEDGFVGEEPEEDEEQQQQNHESSASVEQQEDQEDHNNSNQSANFSASEDFVSVPSGELTVPADDLADLEWLSHFVEDSFSEFSVPYPAGTLPEKPKWQKENRPQPVTPVAEKPCFKTPVPAKARSKRTRTGGRVWSLGSPAFTESSTSSTSESSSSSPSNSSPWLIWPSHNLGSSFEPAKPVSLEKPLTKKHKKKSATDDATAGGGSGALTPRRCSHCGVQKTPQWRAGPLGAKTLCNACGVRYKSGRLLPEYRPACSPTFSTELHSNHHRKVMEMRRKKVGQPESDLGPPAAPSF